MTDHIVLTATEFEVVWDTERLGARHAALDVPSPGATHSERAVIVDDVWASLEARGFARRRNAAGDLLDLLGVLAAPTACVDLWIWADDRISGLAATTGEHAAVGIVERGEVWLVPVEPSMLAESAVAVAGSRPAGVGQSVTLPHRVLVAAAHEAHGDAYSLVTALEDAGVPEFDAHELAGMLLGVHTKGQFGAERIGAAAVHRRADQVVAFHDTDAGRYLMQVTHAAAEAWCTVAPADNAVLEHRVAELLESCVLR